MLTRSYKKQLGSQAPTFIAPYNDSIILLVEMTKSHFLDAYSKGTWNLSHIQKPKCLQELYFMKPPESFRETSRAKVANRYLNAEQWDQTELFRKMIGSLKKLFQTSGCSISVVTTNKVVSKYECFLNTNEVSRLASIDGHAILSKDYFLVLDASKDWRTIHNPFVSGIPHIKFYCGVPIYLLGESIGILSVFDSFPKKLFLDDSIIRLKKHSEEIAEILNTPVEVLEFKNRSLKSRNSYDEKAAELLELKLKLGRATSRGSLMTVFEKDGSGGPYSQNHNFHFLTKISDPDEKQIHLDNQNLQKKLISMGSIRKAASLLCKTICSSYTVDFVYILEVRTAEKYSIESKYFPRENKVEFSTFKHADKLVKKEGKSEFMSRIIGNYGGSQTSLNFENLMHLKCFESEFGIHYKNPNHSTSYNCGVMMPFYRQNSKIVRQKKLKGNETDKPSIEVFLRSGGFIIGVFNRNGAQMPDSQTISKIFGNACVLRKLYTVG